MVTGTVADPGETPIAGARVLLQLPCSGAGVVLIAVRSQAGGRFRHTAGWDGPVGTRCFRIWAEPPEGSILAASDTQAVELDFRLGASPDSVDIRLALRTPPSAGLPAGTKP